MVKPVVTYDEFLTEIPDCKKTYLEDGMKLGDIPASKPDMKAVMIRNDPNERPPAKKQKDTIQIRPGNKEGFDIYKYAEEFDADFLDPRNGYVYKVQEYNRAKKLGFPALIRIVDSMTGELIGHALPETKE